MDRYLMVIYWIFLQLKEVIIFFVPVLKTLLVGKQVPIVGILLFGKILRCGVIFFHLVDIER
ncbi:hypothetical protein AK51_15230 [Serratia nematodiphila DZ0503SBS1]|nr:hypothetical protein AK51_15250 [Serratia nematodiphila DZ0503SBS1]OQV65877.1 hypothetical protein AK51_15230 [Serratia nematodiphila DZ0503SBS1]